MPKYEVPVPKLKKYTNESLAIPPNMIDEDNRPGVEEEFRAGASLQEGVAGRKSIDTLYDNISEDIVDSPRSDKKESPIGGLTANHSGTDVPAPVCTDLDDYPHRRY